MYCCLYCFFDVWNMLQYFQKCHYVKRITWKRLIT